jgi:serine/threonine-protein kinase
LSSQDKADPLIGTIIADRYQILDVLGQGGWGVVYHAVHTLMDRDVAIKLLHARFLEDETNRKRFQQEAQAVSRLSHPNIIGVHDFGMTPEGHHFLVMDFVKGTTLASILDQEGFLPVDRALPIFIQICAGLAHAHENGIIHRDLKPGNIMIVPVFEGDELVKILDFGVAKVAPKAGGRVQQLTLTGEIFGTSLYLSPEQCMGRTLDARSDIYSLGCVMYETLSGLPPHIGENLLDTLQKHIADAAIPLRQARDGLDIPQDLDDVVLKTLEKEPANRMQSARDLKQALEQVKLGLDSNRITFPMPGHPPVMPLTPSDPGQPLTRPATLSGQAELGAGPTPAPPPAPTSSASHAGPASGQYQAAAVSGQYQTAPASGQYQAHPASGQYQAPPPAGHVEQGHVTGQYQSGPATEQSPGTTTSAPMHGVTTTQRTFPPPLIAAACALALAGGVGAWFAFSRSASGPAAVQPVDATGSGDAALWKQLNDAGQKAFDEGKYEEAEKQFLAASKEAEKFGVQDRRLILTLRKVSDVYYTLGKDADAEKVDQRIQQLRNHTRGAATEAVVDQPEQQPEPAGIKNDAISDRLANLARVCHEGGQCEKAEELLRRSVEISKKVFGPDSPQVAQRMNDLAAFYLSLGMYDKAEPLFQEVLKVGKKAPSARIVTQKGMEGYAKLLRETDRAKEASKLEQGAKGI